MAKGFRTAGLLLILCLVLLLNVPAAYAAGTGEDGSETGTTFTFTVEDTEDTTEETTSNDSQNPSEAKNSPKNGDTSNPALWFVLLLVSGAAIGTTVVIKNKK